MFWNSYHSIKCALNEQIYETPVFKQTINALLLELRWRPFNFEVHELVLLLNKSSNLFSLENPKSPPSPTH